MLLPDWIDDRDLADDGPSEEEMEQFYRDMPVEPPPTDEEITDMCRRNGLDQLPF